MRTIEHPVLRFAPELLCGACAIATLVISSAVNPHSVSWLLAGYASVALCLHAWRPPRTKVRNAYALYHAVLGAYLLLVWMLHVSVPLSRHAAPPSEMVTGTQLLRFGSVYAPIAMFYFCRRFLGLESRLLKMFEIVGWVVATFLYISSFFGLFFGSYRWIGITWIPTMTRLYPIYAFYGAAYVSVGVAAALKQIVSNRDRRLQFVFFIVGAAPMWIACLGNLLISIGIRLYPMGGLLFVAHVGILAFAVLKYKVYDVSLTLRQGLVYAMVSAALGAILGVLLWITSSWLDPRPANQFLAAMGFALITAFLYAPALGVVQRLVDRVFFRRTADEQTMLQQLLLDTTATLNLEHVSRRLCRYFGDSFHPEEISLYYVTDDKRLVLFAKQRDTFERQTWPDGKTVLTLDDAKENVRSGGPLRLVSAESGIRVPITHNDAALGWIVLGPKRADERYSEHDVRLAESATAHIGVVVHNAWAYQRMQYLGNLTDQTLCNLAVAVFVVKENGAVVQANPAAAKLIGGTTLFLKDVPESHAALRQVLVRIVETAEACTNLPVTIPGSAPLHLLLTVRILAGNGETRQFLVLVADISDYKVLEANAQRMEGLATLGGTIASNNHEIRNILQPIQIQVNAVLAIPCEDERFARAFSIISDRLVAMQKLLEGLKYLSRPIDLRPREGDLTLLIQSVWSDLRGLPCTDGVTLEHASSEQPVLACVDGYWMRMVFYNLLRNAAEATLGCERRKIQVRAAAHNDFVIVEFADTGCGISESARKKLFGLFFSTKGEAGNGLGLSVCKRIVDLHGGQITVDSAPGAGTTFKVALPRRDL